MRKLGAEGLYGRPMLVLGALVLATVASWVVPQRHGGILAAVLLALAWFWIARFFYQSGRERRMRDETLVQLNETVDRWASGDLQARVYLDQEDPLDSLAHGLNRVAEVLTERTRDLEQDKQRLEAILTSMANGIILLSHGLTITLTNAAAIRLFRIEEGQVIGRHLLEVIRDVGIDDAVHKVTREGGVQTVEWTPPDDDSTVVEVTVAALTQSRDGLGAVLVARDVSSQRQVDRMRQDFVANVSHELQTPLTIIRGFTETLIDDPDSDIAARFIQLIHDEADRMSRLVDDLLALSRMEHHSLPVARQPVDILMLADSIITKITPRAQSAGLTITNQLPDTLPLVAGDGDLLNEVFLNLVSNAVQYTAEGGTIRLKGRVDESLGMVGISVEDNGIGIPAADLSRIFERFYRVDKARSRASGGTGLGLAIVKHIMELHKGRIEVRSTVGQGTEFTVWIPQVGEVDPNPPTA